jgi:hypothetical protein
MEKIDRLFGKEITNILDASYLANHRNFSRITSKPRGLSIDQPKKEQLKPSLSITSKPQKIEHGAITDMQCVPVYFEDCLRFMLKQ